MEAIKNFLQLINDNWTLIITIIGLGLAIYKKIVNFINLSEEKKIEIALEQIRKVMLELVTKAETEYKLDTGKLKRSKVLNEVYTRYPILKDIIKQEELEKRLDEIIDENLNTMKDMLSNNREFYKLVYGKYPEE